MQRLRRRHRLLILGRTGYSSKTAGDPYLLMSIAAVVIGGTSILGGRGKYIGTIGGALVLTVLINVLTVENISEAGRMMIQGRAHSRPADRLRLDRAVIELHVLAGDDETRTFHRRQSSAHYAGVISGSRSSRAAISASRSSRVL